MSKKLVILSIFSTLAFLSGCQRDVPQEKPVEETALVKVNGDVISKQDLQIAAVRIVGSDKAYLLDDIAQKKILDSLVMSRVISAKSLQDIDKEELEQIERKTRDYREELLVKSYLRKNIQPQPVTSDVVKEYYESHPELFGAQETKEFELITTTSVQKGEQRDQLLSVLNKARGVTNWKKYVANANKNKNTLEYRTGKSNEKLLKNQLRAVIKNMKEKDISRPVFVEGKPYIFRITKVSKSKPRPLVEVSTEIRRQLALKQMKEAVKSVSDKLMKEAKIEYIEQ